MKQFSKIEFSEARRALLARMMQNEGLATPVAQGIPVREERERAPLSLAQRRLWFINQLEPDNPVYNNYFAFRLKGTLNLPALQQAIDEIVNRHEILRTTFAMEGSEPVQVITDLKVKIVVIDVDDSSEDNIKTLATEEARRPFDLTHGPLVRMTVLRFINADSILLFTIHHIISDGWSLGIFIEELSNLYQTPSALSDLRVQYGDFAAWQKNWLDTTVRDAQLPYWKERLANTPSTVDLPFDYARPPVQRFRGTRETLHISNELAEQLRTLSQRTGRTMFMLLLAAFKAFLCRYTRQEDILIGTPVAGRPRPEVEPLIGFFANMVVLRTNVSDDLTFAELLDRVSETTISALAHQDIPFEVLVEELNPERGLDQNPLFQIAFTLHKGQTQQLHLPDLTLERFEVDAGTSKFDLTLDLVDTGKELIGAFEYNSDLFDARTIRRLAGHFANMLEGVVADPQQQIYNLPLLSKADQYQALIDWNDTTVEYDGSLCAHQLFERQVEEVPEAIALASRDGSLTYRELNTRANQLAHHLQALGIGPEKIVGICIDRSFDFAIAALGVLKAGGAYVPLDYAYPSERLQYMLQDSSAGVLLTNQRLADSLETSATKICLDSDWQTIAQRSCLNPSSEVTSQNLAYVIYTSGSTGQPKGVAVEHQGLVNLVQWTCRVYNLGPSDRATQVAGLGFDACVWELWFALASGASLWFPDAETRNSPETLKDWLLACEITVSFLPTPLAEAALALSWPREAPLRALFTGGDRLREYPSPELPFQLVNHYGPTEASVIATSTPVQPNNGTSELPSIGHPIDNMRVYLFDQRLKLVPVRTPGELYIAGTGLARGYLNRPDLTAESYLPNPFATTPGERVYKSGDLARHNLDGSIEYLHRGDRQIKIRGFRVELQEMEFALRQHPSISDAVVTFDEKRSMRSQLVAYVVADKMVQPAELKSFLKDRLPEYMVPTCYVMLDQMPLTPNGKVDRRALPAPQEEDVEVAARPLNPLEEIVAGLWAEVLGLQNVGAEDNFFDLGGHSLLATQVVSRVRNSLGVEVPLRTVFANPTVAGMCEEIRQQQGTTVKPAVQPRAAGIEIPLSLAQQRLWFIDQLEPGTGTYNIAAAVRLSGTLERAALGQSLSEIVRRHEVLRTRFESRSQKLEQVGKGGLPPLFRDGHPIQIVTAASEHHLPLLDLSALDESEQEQRVGELAREEAGHGFDLSKGPLFRTTLLQLNETEHVLLVTMHHIVSDGWSVGVMVRELSALYEAYREGKESPLPELQLQYGDYAVWQREQEHAGAEHMSYWREQLADVSVLELPTDRPRPAVASYRGDSESFSLGAELSRGLKDLSRREGVTLFMTLLSGFQVLLGRYSNQQDIAVGTPSAGRQQAEVEDLIGFFVNTLVMRTDLSGNPTVRELLARVREMSLAAYEHQEVPFERLVEELQPERSLTHQPLFQVMFLLQGNPLKALSLSGVDCVDLKTTTQTSQFDLTLAVSEEAEELSYSITYATDLFDATTVRRMGSHFRRVLEGMVIDAQTRIQELPLLNSAENNQILVEFNDTAIDYNQPACVHQLFEQQVERTPDATALIYEDQSVSYRELNRRANQLANYLQTKGVGLETRVAICMERSVEMMVSLLGVLKAGGAYVPIDPWYPQERIEYMVRDAAAEVILTQQHLAERVSEIGVTVVSVDQEWETIGAQSGSNFETAVSGENLIYVIYTSGSTGLPKGAMNTHAAVSNRLLWMHQEYGLNETDRVLQKTPYTFDVSGWEFFWPVLAGGCLVMARPEGHRDPDYLNETIQTAGITKIHFVPPMLRTWLASDGAAKCTSLKQVFCSGEALDAESVARFNSSFNAEIHNLYGPTEVAIDVTYWRCSPDWDKDFIPIGKPIANTQIYILDQQLKPVPIGVSGELYIAGDGLARGYLNRAELTAEKFIADPFSNEPGARMYRSGDLARFLPDGEIEYLGRIDHQVKMRGYRIELGEIEAVLSEYEGVEQAVVVLCPEEQRLVAYVVGADVSGEQLRAYLSGRVPEYMVPSAFVKLAQLPLTGSGKVDRRALPKPEGGGTEYVGPRNEIEEVLCGIWSELLGVEHVGVHDNFFHIGGHSLLATQVVSRVRNSLGVEVPLRAIFANPTVAGMCEQIQQHKGTGGAVRPAAQAREAGAEIPLSLAQQRLWLVDQLEPGNGAYNIPGAVRLSGKLERAALVQALSEIVRRHEVLRTTFASRGGNAIQIVGDVREQALPLLDLRALEGAEQEQRVSELAREEAARGFDLSKGPLFRTTLLQLSETEHVLLVTMHHIVSDGWSVGVMVRELSALYEAYREGKESPLPELQLQYGDYAVWQREQEHAGAEHMSYWREQLADVSVLELPTDRPRPAVASYRGDSESFSLGAELSRGLKDLSRREGVTLFMTLLSGFQVLLGRYSNQQDIAVGTPSAGRQQAEVEDLIGFFVNTLVMRTDLSGNPSVSELLGRVREMSLAAYEHQEVPFERLVEELQPERSLTHQPLFQVWFVLQNTPAEKANIPGLNIQSLPIEDSFSKYDLMLSIDEAEESLPGTLHFRTDLFDRGTVQRVLEHFRRVLEGMVAGAQTRIQELPLLNAAENEQILVEFNNTAAAYDRHACIHQQFEQQVERTPDATALIYEDQHVSYREFNRRANQLANYLKAKGVGLETRVAICMERSVEMMISLLGVLKAGGAYVPIDPAYPRERIDYMLGNAAAEVILTQQHLAERLNDAGVAVVSVDQEWETIALESGSNCETAVDGENLVYLIFTSGSTGLPKAVGVTHRGLTNYLSWCSAASITSGKGQCPVHSSLSFDLVVTSLYPPLLSGQTLALLPNREELDALADGLIENRFDMLKLTPSHLKALNQLVKGKIQPHTEGCFVIGGEALSYEDLSFWQNNAPAIRLINEYGPTEATVGCTVHEVPRESRSGSVPIGKPLVNTQMYILDQQLQPVPIGVNGELYIGGDGLARGYLNRPDLTAEKFIANPFSQEPGARMYRTGDLARFRPDGDIEYLGRIDHQVKLRGYRIELGEIEAALNEHEGVEQAVVVLRPEEQRLVAYVVGVEISVEQLRTYLSGRVPEYMVPSVFVKLAQLPFTGNGKVDRQALPKPEIGGSDDGYADPRNEIEKELCAIWSEILDVEQVGIHDNFFELGGDSILSIQVVARAREANIQLVPKHFFEHQTIAQLAEVAAESVPQKPVSLAFEFAGTELEKLKESDPQIEDIYPLSPTQQGMLFHSLFAPESGVYFDQLIFTFRGELNKVAFRQAWTEVVNHHAALRTSFLWEDLSEPVQVVQRHVELPWEEQDWQNLSFAEEQEQLEAHIKTDRKRPVDLSRAPLMRFCLVRTSENGYQLIWSRHHLLLDGWSSAVMLKQVFDSYERLNQGEPVQLEQHRPYKDYIVWLKEQNKSAAESFWRDTLRGHQEPTPLCIDSVKRRSDTTETYGRYEIQLAHESTSKLREFARRHQLTLNTIIEGAWGLLLSRYSGKARVVLGTTVAGRPTELDGVERMVGLFINTVPLMVEIDEHQPAATWLQQLQQKHAGIRQYEYSPLVEIQGWSDVPRGRPLFESLFVFENYPVDATLKEAAGLEIQKVRTSEQTNYPITLVAIPSAELALRINYQEQRFPESAIRRMLGHLQCLLESIVASPEQAIAKHELMPVGERQQILNVWSDTESAYPGELCLHELFEQQVVLSPDATALVHEQHRVSYRELNHRANQLAHYLRELGVGPEVRVAICMERGVEMIIGLLGVLKAGGAYVPIDPSYPRERVEYILNNSAVVALLTQPQLSDKLAEHSLPLVIVDTNNRQITKQPDINLNTVVTPENLAYIIYTSGSTGAPKGVMVTHQNVARLFAATDHWFNFSSNDVWTLFHSFAFDFSVWEIYGALLYGGKLVVVPYWISRSPEAFYELLSGEGVTVLNQTPSAFQQLMRVEDANDRVLDPELRLVIFGGEALELQSLQPWFERHGDEHPTLVNMYGITETTVHVTYRPLVTDDAQGANGSVIGRAIPDLQIYILDEQNRVVPAGIAGEMYVGGAGVARGYVNRPDLAAQRFVPHPFSTTPGARLYRTGDLARWSDKGELEYLGRNDHQVKIRGFRIETGEIESVLLERKEVAQAIVLVREEEGRAKQLAAYVVSSNGYEPSGKELRSYLQERLPDYMVPASVAVLAEMPLTSNGKIDRQSLLSMSASRMLVESGDDEGAQNEVEALLVQVWQEVLGLEQVGIHENFFELGGDSILSIQIVAKAKRGGLTLKVQQIFQYQTIAELARVVSTSRSATELDEAVGEVPLTPIQARFFELGLPNVHHFNQAVMLEVDHRPDLRLLEVVINKLIEHHDALRLRFSESGDGWQQAYAETESQQVVSEVDLSYLSSDEQLRQLEIHAAAAQASLDITAGPLMRVVVFDLGNQNPARLLIAIHHLAIDGVSWRILMEDLQTAYEQLRRGEDVELPGKTNSFKRWSETLRQYASSAELESEAGYWLDERRRDVPRLPVDFERGENTVASANSILVELSREETHTLLQEVPKAYHTQIQEVLATAVALSLREWTGADKVLLEMEGHGREEVVAGVDVSRTVGWFTSIYPVLLELGGDEISTALKSIKEQLRKVPQRGIGYGIWKYLRAGEAERAQLRELAAAEVSFNYLGQFDQVLTGGEFRAAAESTGAVQDDRGKREHLIAINGMVADGQLRMTWGYSEAVHRTETIERVAMQFADVLRELIEHCQSEDAGGHTPSDFPLAELDQESLDMLVGSFEAF